MGSQTHGFSAGPGSETSDQAKAVAGEAKAALPSRSPYSLPA